jgi:hypothetical protein
MMSTSLHTHTAAETRPADGEFMKLQSRTRIPVISRRDCQILYLNKHKIKIMHQGGVFCRVECEFSVYRNSRE